MSPILTIQRRMMELGRIRMGDKGPKGEPRKLTAFRLTSASRGLLDAAAQVYGGSVRGWEGAPDEGYYELFTETDTLEIILPPVFSDRDGSPTAPYSQWFEHWTAAGCQRRCDGETEALTGQPCMCAAKGAEPGEDLCKVTTRVSMMLPQIPGLGVWRLESHGWNAATLLPGTLELLRMAAEGNTFIPAVLRLEQRTSKKPGQQTRKFIIPVIDLPQTRVGELLGASGPLAVNMPAPAPPRPALPAAEPLPPDPTFRNGAQDFGEPPPLPGQNARSFATPGEDGEAVFQPQNAEDAGASGAASPEWADEHQIPVLLDLANRLGAHAHDAAMNSISAHRAKNDGRVKAEWLARQLAAVRAKLPAGESSVQSAFPIPEKARS